MKIGIIGFGAIGFDVAKKLDQEKDQWGVVNDVVIPRDTKLPCSITKNYAVLHDDQQTIDCSVTQSEGEESNIDFVVVIAKEPLKLSKNTKR